MCAKIVRNFPKTFSKVQNSWQRRIDEICDSQVNCKISDCEQDCRNNHDIWELAKTRVIFVQSERNQSADEEDDKHFALGGLGRV